jgi:hypothetical protein
VAPRAASAANSMDFLMGTSRRTKLHRLALYRHDNTRRKSNLGHLTRA